MVDGPESLSPLDEQAGGITRRQALKRGALLGGALAWATPVVQVIGMQPAFAQVPSPTCTFCIDSTCFTLPPDLCECVVDCLEEGGEFFACLTACFAGLRASEISLA
jgi:hypothetical protein